VSTAIKGVVPAAAMQRVAAMLRRTFQTDLRWLDGMSWRRVGWLFVIVAGLTAYSVPGSIFFDGPGFDASPGDYLDESAQWYVRYLWALFPVLLALTFADNLPLTGRPRKLALLVALLLASLANWPLACLCRESYYFACNWFPSWKSWLRFFPDNTGATFFLGGAIALAFFARRHDHRVAQALHAAELERVDAQRRMLEADLQAMQAQVEPAFLLGTLEDVGGLSEIDPDAGDRVLDALILFLRAALPHLRETTSTLSREVDLARAYLSIAKVRQKDRLSFFIDAPERMRDARMPPMLLLPLLEGVINREQERATTGWTIRIVAASDNGRLILSVTDTSAGFAPGGTGEAGIRGIRERLDAIYGRDATLALQRSEQLGTCVVLEIPYEHMEGSNR
ncbi:MAG: histidine kinase, partial [Betaproteobacteria bacterium]